MGQDLQAFAQTNLFGRIGIPADSYIWLRDRSGNTYGYANLFIPPIQFAKLGLLMQNNGNWNGRQILSTTYISQLRQPTTTNGCYGFLFWVNGGTTCTSANIPAAQVVDNEMIPSRSRRSLRHGRCPATEQLHDPEPAPDRHLDRRPGRHHPQPGRAPERIGRRLRPLLQFLPDSR